MPRNPLDTLSALFYGGVMLILFLFAAHALGVATDDEVLVQAFSIDESRALAQLQLNLAERDLDPRGFYNYGYVYNTLCYGFTGIAKPATRLTPACKGVERSGSAT